MVLSLSRIPYILHTIVRSFEPSVHMWYCTPRLQFSCSVKLLKEAGRLSSRFEGCGQHLGHPYCKLHDDDGFCIERRGRNNVSMRSSQSKLSGVLPGGVPSSESASVP